VIYMDDVCTMADSIIKSKPIKILEVQEAKLICTMQILLLGTALLR